MIEPTIKAYLRMVQLSDELKAKHKIKIGASVPRFDVVCMCGDYSEIEQLKNAKGMLFFGLYPTRYIQSQGDYKAERCLMGKHKGNSFNLTSLYLSETKNAPTLCGFGTPNKLKAYGKDKTPNPFFESRSDGYIFLISDNWQTIEMLVIVGAMYNAETYCKALERGEFADILETYRAKALPVYGY